MRTRATETRSRPIARLVFFPTWRARRRVFSPSRRWTSRRRRDIFPIPPPSNPPNFSRTSKDAKTRTRRRSGVPSDRNICAACPSGDDGVHAPPSTHVETVVAEGIVASRTKTRFGDGKVSESDAKTLCLAAKTHLASYLASRAIRPSDPHGRRLDTALCVLWAETGAAGALESALASNTTRDVDRDVVARVATREGRHHAFAVSASATRAHETAMERWRHLATGVVEESRARTAAAPPRILLRWMRRRRRGGRRRDASPKTLRGGGRSGRSDARGRAREATRALDSRARSRRGCVGARGSESATRDASAGRDGARGTPRPAATARQCWRRGARRGCPVAATPLRTSNSRWRSSPRAIRRRRSRFYRGNRDLYDPARTLAAMDPARVTSSDLRDGLIEDSSTARASRTVTWTRSRRGSIASPSRTPFSATTSRRFDFSSKSRRIVRVVDAFANIASRGAKTRRTPRFASYYGEAFPRISTRRGRWWRIRTCPWTWTSREPRFETTLEARRGTRSKPRWTVAGKTIAAGRTTRLHSETSRTVFRVSSLVVRSPSR